MIVNDELVLQRCLRYAVGKFNSLLVVAVEEVYLESLRAHGLVFCHCLVEMLVENVEHCHQNDIHAL